MVVQRDINGTQCGQAGTKIEDEKSNYIHCNDLLSHLAIEFSLLLILRSLNVQAQNSINKARLQKLSADAFSSALAIITQVSLQLTN